MNQILPAHGRLPCNGLNLDVFPPLSHGELKKNTVFSW